MEDFEEKLFYSYFAGCIDCDGCIVEVPHKTCKSFRLNLTQHEQYFMGMQDIVNKLTTYGYTLSFNKRISWAEKYDSYMYDINIKERKSVIKLLANLIPFLVFKKDKAIMALNYLKERDVKAPLNRGEIFTQSKRRYWTEDEHQELIKLHSEGYTNTGIAKVLNRSRESVGHRLHRHGVLRNQNSKEEECIK